MTTIANSLSAYANSFTYARVKAKAQKIVTRFFKDNAPPHENVIRMIARKAFEALSALLMMATAMIALAPMSAGFALYRAFQPRTYYTIENPNGPLLKGDILAHLKYLKASGVDIETI